LAAGTEKAVSTMPSGSKIRSVRTSGSGVPAVPLDREQLLDLREREVRRNGQPGGLDFHVICVGDQSHRTW
jgi:hypothetical protein